MPVVTAVEDGEGLSDVEVEEAVGWKCPFAVVAMISPSRYDEHERTMKG